MKFTVTGVPEGALPRGTRFHYKAGVYDVVRRKGDTAVVRLSSIWFPQGLEAEIHYNEVVE